MKEMRGEEVKTSEAFPSTAFLTARFNVLPKSAPATIIGFENEKKRHFVVTN